METAPRGEADLVCQAPCENANRPCERSQDKAHFKEIRKKKKKKNKNFTKAQNVTQQALALKRLSWVPLASPRWRSMRAW